MLSSGATPKVMEISASFLSGVLRDYEFKSIVGHENTAKLLSDILGTSVPFNRETIRLEVGDTLYVAQYFGPRLPEGATVLPEGASFRYFAIYLLYLTSLASAT